MKRRLNVGRRHGLLLLVAITACLLWGWPGMVGSAEAAAFSDVITWGDKDTKIKDYFEYTHTLDNLSPPALRIDSANLSLQYTKNFDTPRKTEVWIVQGGENSIYIGTLPQNNSNAASSSTLLTATFGLNAILSQIMTGSTESWMLAVRLMEDTEGNDDWIRLYNSTLSGTYTPVPIPATVFLLGSGIVGLIALSRRRRP